MSSIWSSDAETLVGSPSKESVRYEVANMGTFIQREKNKNSMTIVVVRDSSLKKLEKEHTPSKWWSAKQAPPAGTIFTGVEGLQMTIDSIELSPKRRILTFLVSTEVLNISFDAPSCFSELRVLRCASKHDKGNLFIDGSSTYNGVRLDKWQAHHHKKHTFIINHERGTQITLLDITGSASWARSRSDFTASEQEDLHQHFRNLSRQSNPDEAKGILAIIIGILVGGCKFTMAMNGAAGGMYLKYAFGFHALELGLGGGKGGNDCYGGWPCHCHWCSYRGCYLLDTLGKCLRLVEGHTFLAMG